MCTLSPSPPPRPASPRFTGSRRAQGRWRSPGRCRPKYYPPLSFVLSIPWGTPGTHPSKGTSEKALHVLLKLRRPMTFRTGCLCGLCRLPLGCPPVSRKGLQAWPGWTRKSPQRPTGSEFAGRGRGPALSLLHWPGADLKPRALSHPPSNEAALGSLEVQAGELPKRPVRGCLLPAAAGCPPRASPRVWVDPGPGCSHRALDILTWNSDCSIHSRQEEESRPCCVLTWSWDGRSRCPLVSFPVALRPPSWRVSSGTLWGNSRKLVPNQPGWSSRALSKAGPPGWPGRVPLAWASLQPHPPQQDPKQEGPSRWLGRARPYSS